MTAEKTPVDYSKPVAYDVEGKPLYAHPPVENENNGNGKTQAVHIIRPSEPERRVISETIKKKHDRSRVDFPDVYISESEYIIKSIPRHLIGMFLPVFLGTFLISLSLIIIFNFDIVSSAIKAGGAEIHATSIVAPLVVFIGLVILATCIAYYVYTNNRFFLTNESIIQEIQTNIFSKKVRIVSLADIEDVSYTQNGILQQVFDYGSLRLSTEGEGTIYRFTFVQNPKSKIAYLSNAVEAFKNGRAIDLEIDPDTDTDTDTDPDPTDD